MRGPCALAFKLTRAEGAHAVQLSDYFPSPPVSHAFDAERALQAYRAGAIHDDSEEARRLVQALLDRGEVWAIEPRALRRLAFALHAMGDVSLPGTGD